ncbi:hypothetical protein M408DRAFT_233126 [Serendipita vermifera MAFF 305830]|uniref:Uncharacterized protein n=1 Tax=Serendipita vermifera MAFF 305830 TaxID=933852 RepID=A0A0C2X4V3_SERVB|nr:hypothetical protein M408DRAFT_233126 [Serendipita vermifera MAFF 305830]
MTSSTVQPPALIVASADQEIIGVEYCDSLIGRLPVELLIAIIRCYCQRIWSRIKLTHVCQYWRVVMIDEASMWTYVEVPRINSDQASKMEGFFRVLDMQLSRTAELPLDVVFFPPEAQSIHNRIIEIFLKYETFPRWRSLVLRMDYIENLDRPNASQRPDTHFFVSERFCGLESLKLVYYSYVSLFESLRGTIAGRPSSLPRLTLELFNTYVNTVEARERLSVQGEMVSMIYGESLDQLSGLILPNFAGHRFESEFLPRHITEIECAVRSSHPFPHAHSSICSPQRST